MISDRLAHLQAKLDSLPQLPAETRAEIEQLLAGLKTEIAALPQAPLASDESISSHVEDDSHDIVGDANTPDSIQLSLDRLTASVEEFEASHPELTSTVQRLATVLSNMGI